MSKLLKKEVEEAQENENLVLIKWDRDTGDYTIHVAGPAITVPAVATLFKIAILEIHECADENGFVIFSKNAEEDEDEKKRTKNVPGWMLE